MSFRELRNFIESMKALGYPRLISVDNFRTPNFELVADSLYWLVHRYDPTADVDDAIGSEHERVEFLKSVATVMMSKARVKLNIKQLYRADGYAVKELLKISSLLYDAIKLEADGGLEGGTEEGGATDANGVKSPASVLSSPGGADAALVERLEELKEARALASEIVDSGSKLYALLAREQELKESREKAMHFLDSISLHLDASGIGGGGAGDPSSLIDRSIREQLSVLSENISELQRMHDDAETELKSLRSKIERKTTELERAEKRLRSLQKVKPAFLAEYEGLEAELKGVYDQYLERFRNLHYLEHELTKYQRAEMEKKGENDRALKRMQRRLREEELRILRGDQPVDERHMDDEDEDEEEDRSSASGGSSGSSSSSSEDDSSSGLDGSDSDDGLSGRRGGRRPRRRGKQAKPRGHGMAFSSRMGGGGGRVGGRMMGSLAGGDSDSDDDSDESDASSGGLGGGGSDDDSDLGGLGGLRRGAAPGAVGGGGGGFGSSEGEEDLMGHHAFRSKMGGLGGEEDSEPPSDDDDDDDDSDASQDDGQGDDDDEAF